MFTPFLSVQEKNGMKERLKVEHLSVSFFTDEGEVQAVRDVSFSLNAGEVLAVVGESGCGKSVLCKSIMKLLPENVPSLWTAIYSILLHFFRKCTNYGRTDMRW